jgi:hypothetical protein
LHTTSTTQSALYHSSQLFALSWRISLNSPVKIQ